MNGPVKKTESLLRADSEDVTPIVTIAGMSISLHSSNKRKCAYGGRCNKDSECNIFAFPEVCAVCKKLGDNLDICESSGPKTLFKDVVPSSHPMPSTESKDWVSPGAELEVVKTRSYENISPNLPTSIAGCSSERHLGVGCGECGGAIVGFRYKCVTCAHFDLCAACEARGAHAQHVMMRFARPIKFQTARELILAWCQLLKAKDLLSPYEKPRQLDWEYTCWKTGPLGKYVQAPKPALGKTIQSAKSIFRGKNHQNKKHGKTEKRRGETNISHTQSAKSDEDSIKIKKIIGVKSVDGTGKQKDYSSKRKVQSQGGTASISLKRAPTIEENKKNNTKLTSRHLKRNVIQAEQKKSKNRRINKHLHAYLENREAKLCYSKPTVSIIKPDLTNGKRDHLASTAEVVAPQASSPVPNKPSSDPAVNVWCYEYDTTVPRPPTIKTYSRPKIKPGPESSLLNSLSSSLPIHCIGADRVQPEDARKEYNCADEIDNIETWIKKEIKMEILDTPNGVVQSYGMFDCTEPTTVRMKEEPDPL